MIKAWSMEVGVGETETGEPRKIAAMYVYVRGQVQSRVQK